MNKVYIVIWTFTRDTDDDYCQPETSIVGAYSTKELAEQKITELYQSHIQKEVLSYENYTSRCIDNGYVSSDPELDYCNYLHVMRDTTSSSYYCEELPVLDKLGE